MEGVGHLQGPFPLPHKEPLAPKIEAGTGDCGSDQNLPRTIEARTLSEGALFEQNPSTAPDLRSLDFNGPEAAVESGLLELTIRGHAPNSAQVPRLDQPPEGGIKKTVRGPSYSQGGLEFLAGHGGEALFCSDRCPVESRELAAI